MSENRARSRLLHSAKRYAFALRLACLWGGILITAVLLRALIADGGRSSDFALFYEAIERFRSGRPMYGSLFTIGRSWLDGPNYNPPHFHLIVLPFALLPFAAAFVLWTVTGLSAGLFGAWRTVRSLRLNLVHHGVLLVGGLILATAVLGSTLRLGQLSLILAVPVCLAWIAAREARWVHAGAWIGLAASIKPFLFIVAPYFLLKRRWRALAAMTASVVLSFALGTLVFGVDALLGWAGAFAVPRVQDHFHNASFAGLMARGLDAEGIYVARITAALGVVLTLWAAIRSRDIDLTWLLLMAGALLWSPLGWIYYGWFLMPPLVALGATGGLPKLAWIGVVLWLWPPYTPRLTGAEVPIAVTVGSVYFWGLFLIWVAAVRAARFQTLAPRDSLAGLHLDGSLNKSRPGQTLPSDSGGTGSHPPISPDDPALPGRSGSAGSGIHLDGGGEEGSTGEQEGRRG